MFAACFNHLSLHVSNLEKSKDFYGNILGMKEIERPNFPYNGAWYDMGYGLSLHLIEGKNYETQAGSRGNHFAFETENVQELENELKHKGVEIVSNKIRVDGIRQLFVKDPDGYFVEFNEAKKLSSTQS